MNLKATLSVSSLNKLKEQVDAYRDALPQKEQAMLQAIADRGFDLVLVNLSGIEYTGELINSISTTVNQGQASINVNSKHAIYVEFGTGPKGSASPYVHAVDTGISYPYMVGDTIGWYKVKGEWRFGWFYPDEMTGTYRFTEGMPSRPYMYNTAQQLRQELATIIRGAWSE